MEVVLCPRCRTVSSIEAWDEATQEIYGDDSESIEVVVIDNSAEEPADMYWFACPACGEDNICGDTIQDVQEDMEDEE